jgi:hypothetical protein
VDARSAADLQKIVVSQDSKTLLGGVLVGDASEYATLVQMMLNGISLPKEPETLILPALPAVRQKRSAWRRCRRVRRFAHAITSAKAISARPSARGNGYRRHQAVHQSGHRLRRL